MLRCHTEEQFNLFLSQLTKTNADLSFWTDFDKVRCNVSQVAIRLNTLNYLIGQTDIEKAVCENWKENPQGFSVLDILIAVRTKDKKVSLARDGKSHSIEDFFTSPKGVIEFIEDTGLKQVFQNKDIKNLVDYVFGIEVGLDTNARKNRSGNVMERLVANIFKKNAISYKEQVASNHLQGLEILGKDNKVFDFVIRTKHKVYLIEVNFYSSGGSKLNEVARSYTDIAPKIASTNNYEFVWITDGHGWLSAKNKLQEAYYNIPKIYNLTSIHDFIAIVKAES